MEFISAEEFLKQDKKVQRVFTDYFDHKEMLFEDGSIYFGTFNYLYTPLLIEGDLREFIEDKTGNRMLPDYNDDEGYSVWLYCEEGELKNKYRKLGEDLLQAYWQVAAQIAKEVD